MFARTRLKVVGLVIVIDWIVVPEIKKWADDGSVKSGSETCIFTGAKARFVELAKLLDSSTVGLTVSMLQESRLDWVLLLPALSVTLSWGSEIVTASSLILVAVKVNVLPDQILQIHLFQ